MPVAGAARDRDVSLTRHPGGHREPDLGRSWMPAYTGMTSTRDTRAVNPPECRTRSKLRCQHLNLGLPTMSRIPIKAKSALPQIPSELY
jgi:hypothetical protein